MNRKSFVTTGVVVLSAIASSALVASQVTVNASSDVSFVSDLTPTSGTVATSTQGIYAPGSASAITPTLLSTSEFNAIFDSRFVQDVTL